MVSNMIVSRFLGPPPPPGSNGPRKISGGPLYPATEVLSLLDRLGSSTLRVWTTKCGDDLQKLSLSLDDAVELLAIALSNRKFIGAEWCIQKPNGPWAACDAYSVVRREWISSARKDMDIEYYIKYAISKAGAILLLVSCHPSSKRT